MTEWLVCPIHGRALVEAPGGAWRCPGLETSDDPTDDRHETVLAMLARGRHLTRKMH